MKQVAALKKNLRQGKVYRYANLMKLLPAAGRHLRQLIKDGTLEKLYTGLYYVPKQSAFGKTVVDEKELLKAFLHGRRFIVTSFNDYNMLGVGTTQLYNERRVYNQKRHGMFKLGSRTFQFVRKPYVPTKLTKEFLLVDLVNNIKQLEEDQPALLDNVRKKAKGMNQRKLKQLVYAFGTAGAKKKFASFLK